MEDYKKEVRRRVDMLIECSGMSASRFAKEAGVQPSSITRFLNGQTKLPPEMTTLLKLETYLRSKGKLPDESKQPLLPDAPAPTKSLIPSRLKIARECYWETVEEAAEVLGRTPDVLRAFEQGEADITADFIVYFAQETEAAMSDWLLYGTISRASPRLAAWIGYLGADLIPDVLRKPGQDAEATSKDA